MLCLRRSVPLRKKAINRCQVHSDTCRKAATTMTGGKILVISDSQNDSEAMHKLLTKEIPQQKLSMVIGLNDLDDREFRRIVKQSQIMVMSAGHLKQLLEHPALISLSCLEWVQLTWAGVEHLIPVLARIDRINKIPYLITRFSGQGFRQLMSEYVIGHLVAWERGFKQSWDDQQQRAWRSATWNQNYLALSDLRYGILGIGEIGIGIVQSLRHFNAQYIKGLGRRRRSELPTGLDEYTSFEELKDSNSSVGKYLSDCDVLISILPHTDETEGLLGGDALKPCESRKPLLINVGRGSLIPETELINALDQKWIQGAILDVFETEPLPSTSELWTRKDVVITPHCSATTRLQDICNFFLQNYQRFQAGEQLDQILDFRKGY